MAAIRHAEDPVDVMLRLRDKIVLVTGAAAGIGSVIADAIVAAGGLAVRSDLERQPSVDHVLDVTREPDWRAVIDRIGADHGRLDGLVNAAGIAVRGTVEQTTLTVWRRAIDVNVLGTFLGARAAWAMLGIAGGSVVNVSSVSGLIDGHDGAADNASHGAVRQLTRAAALDGARQPKRIRVNAVHVPFVDGPMVDGKTGTCCDPTTGREKLLADVPLGRSGRPEDIAACVLYLLSDASAFVTGASYVVDGGLTIGRRR
jgi:NAD(P)-dependent dehydrogenase (short-subunit alcohol dehydrogenase family)